MGESTGRKEERRREGNMTRQCAGEIVNLEVGEGGKRGEKKGKRREERGEKEREERCVRREGEGREMCEEEKGGGGGGGGKRRNEETRGRGDEKRRGKETELGDEE
ncbi:hypothetical protein Pcinc_044143 [Petrolisthes cinctipes]|nr:hypothetical protein Pcinc_044143 [Petrolisthes cinctipes]